MQTSSRSADILSQVRHLVARRLGLHPSTERLAEVIERRLDHGPWTDMQSYHDALAAQPADNEFDQLASLLCVGETYFFRNESHFRLLEQVVLPQLVRDARSRHHLRILSAGCSTGEEPYSLAIALRETCAEIVGWNVEITAIDLLASSLQKAREACYRPWSLRDTPHHLRDRYFTESNAHYRLDEPINQMVRFEQRNLLESDDQFWCADSFDLVFCRNTLMYFSDEAFDAMIERFQRVIRPGGYLFLGHAESLRGIDTHFELHRTDEAFCYRLPSSRDTSSRPLVPSKRVDPSDRIDAAAEMPAPSPPPWMTIIAESSYRIESLGKKVSSTAEHRPSADDVAKRTSHRDASPPQPLSSVRELIAGERFDEALAILEQGSGGQPELQVHLLRAVLLTNQRNIEDAERACRKVLEVDSTHAGAHYLLALCCEETGDLEAARACDRRAIELDPSFSMPHLHLGILARRAGHTHDARHQFAQAYQLLEQDDAERIALYGGGFGRQMLLSLCRAEWSSVEGSHERR